MFALDVPPVRAGIDSNTPIADLVQGVERAIASGASIDNAQIIHLVVVLVGHRMLSEENTIAILPHIVRLGGGVSLANGKAVQVETMRPVLKAPGTKWLENNIRYALLRSAFSFNLRHYIGRWGSRRCTTPPRLVRTPRWRWRRC